MKLPMLLVCAAALWFSPALIADPHSPVNTASFHSLATVAATVTPRATCQGTDGTYTLLAVVGSGPVTSTDPRMSGIFHVNALILDSPTTSLGVSRDDWKITDATTGHVKRAARPSPPTSPASRTPSLSAASPTAVTWWPTRSSPCQRRARPTRSSSSTAAPGAGRRIAASSPRDTTPASTFSSTPSTPSANETDRDEQSGISRSHDWRPRLFHLDAQHRSAGKRALAGHHRGDARVCALARQQARSLSRPGLHRRRRADRHATWRPQFDLRRPSGQGRGHRQQRVRARG